MAILKVKDKNGNIIEITAIVGPQGPSGNDYVLTDADKTEIAGMVPGSDWDASEGEPGYISNRTHWKDKVLAEILPETTEDVSPEIGAATYDTLEMISGTPYHVHYNGLIFENCISYENNGSVMISGDEYPFMIEGYFADDTFSTDCYPTDGATSVTLAIYQVSEEYHTLDPQFIDNEAIMAALPTVEMVATLDDGTTETYRIYGKAVTE